jgi:acetyltransferase
METPPARPDTFAPDEQAVASIITLALAAGRSWLDADEVAAVLDAYGIPRPRSQNTAAEPHAAAAAAEEIGFPVALKVRSPDITHKSDVGGVMLGLADISAVRFAAAAMLERVEAARPDARIEGFLIQQMIELADAVELIAGIGDDAAFGPVIVFGQGGTAVELINDIAIALPPLNTLLARGQMQRTRIWRVLEAHRGRPGVAIDAIAEVLIRLAQLAADHAAIKELDINPLLADSMGVIAVDARIRIAPAAVPGAARLAIAPYPKQHETIATLRDGQSVQLRPIRPEDETLLQDLFAHMSQEDVRLRFFAPIRELGHTMAARLSQIDYDREMALVALHEGVTLGVARYFADPDRLSAEFAVAVRTDWKGRGVGYLLMAHLIDVARRAGIAELTGDVLNENKPMLDMCRVLGFATVPDHRDATLVTVVKPLVEQ